MRLPYNDVDFVACASEIVGQALRLPLFSIVGRALRLPS